MGKYMYLYEFLQGTFSKPGFRYSGMRYIGLQNRLDLMVRKLSKPSFYCSLQSGDNKFDTIIVGLVTHGTDRYIWAFLVPGMAPHQQKVAVAWLDAVDKEFDILERGSRQTRALNQALVLHEDQTITWAEDRRWDQCMKLAKVLEAGISSF